MRNILGEFVRAARHKSGLTLRETCARAGISPPFLSDIELGRRTGSPETLSRLADALGVPVKQLIKADAAHRIAFFEDKITELRRR